MQRLYDINPIRSEFVPLLHSRRDSTHLAETANTGPAAREVGEVLKYVGHGRASSDYAKYM